MAEFKIAVVVVGALDAVMSVGLGVVTVMVFSSESVALKSASSADVVALIELILCGMMLAASASMLIGAIKNTCCVAIPWLFVAVLGFIIGCLNIYRVYSSKTLWQPD